jgi:hypothetical protein
MSLLTSVCGSCGRGMWIPTARMLSQGHAWTENRAWTGCLWACSDVRETVRPKARPPSPGMRSPRRAPSPRRKEPEYAVRLSSHPVTALERDYHEAIRRYARLYISADFSKTVSTWLQVSLSDDCSLELVSAGHFNVRLDHSVLMIESPGASYNCSLIFTGGPSGCQ